MEFLIGVAFLPLSTVSKSEVSSFITKVKADHSFISKGFLFWRDKLVYGWDENVIDPDIREIWRHLVKLYEESEAKERELAEQTSRAKEAAERVSMWL